MRTMPARLYPQAALASTDCSTLTLWSNNDWTTPIARATIRADINRYVDDVVVEVSLLWGASGSGRSERSLFLRGFAACVCVRVFVCRIVVTLQIPRRLLPAPPSFQDRASHRIA